MHGQLKDQARNNIYFSNFFLFTDQRNVHPNSMREKSGQKIHIFERSSHLQEWYNLLS